MKRILCTILMLLLAGVLCLPVLASPPAVDTGEKVYDYAGLLTDSEVQKLQQQIEKASKKTGAEMVVLLTRDNTSLSPRDYADQFFEDNNFGFGNNYNGLMLYVNMSTRDVYMLTSGEAINMFSSADIDRVLDTVAPYLTQGRYHKACSEFVRLGERRLLGKQGNGLTAAMAAAISTFISVIVCIFLVFAHRKSMPAKPGIHAYFDRQGLRMGIVQDQFVHTHTTRTAIPRNDSSGGGGGGSSGGGFHSSSSGRSFGGGGRKF